LRDYRDLGISRPPLKLNGTQDPLLHLFREIRNLEVHLSHSGLRQASKDVLWSEREVSISIWTLDGVTVQSFQSLRNARHYTRDQIDRMVTWFNDIQQEWGVQELFLRAVNSYCGHLILPQA
jgi:hypothetical protein